MKLSEIFCLSFSQSECKSDADVYGVSLDSGKIKIGDIFVAVHGKYFDGIVFLKKAINNGAIAIVYDNRSVIDAELVSYCNQKNVPMFCVQDSEIEAARIAKLLYPNAPKFVFAITGTNGKTTIAHFTEQLLNSAGIFDTATIGTMGIYSSNDKFSRLVDDVNFLIGVNPLTTQDTINTHKILDMTGRAGIKYLVLEASSDGIIHHRLDAVDFTACGISNLSKDHLITHGTMENYLMAKMSLFDKLPDGGVAVFNADDVYSVEFRNHIAAISGHKNLRTIEYGKNVSDAKNGIRLVSVEFVNAGYDLSLEIFGRAFNSRLNLIGEFQIYNALNSLAFAVVAVENSDVYIKKLVDGISNLRTVNGRMEFVAKTSTGADVYVDYSHNSDALKNALIQLRTITKGRLISVSGISSGKSDDRIYTAKVAGETADVVIFTYLSPKTEDVDVMVAKQQAFFPDGLHGGATRYDAIKKAIDMSVDGDVILINGQGHERFIVEYGVEVPFYDADVVREIILKSD